MITNADELRCVFTSASMAHTAYRAWAMQARTERRFNIARIFEALSFAREVRAERAFRQLHEVGLTERNVERAIFGLEPEAVSTGPITGTSRMSRELLARAQTAIVEERDLRAAEIVDLFVCGTCGEISEGALTGACPVCGTVPEAHKSFRAIEAMGTIGPHGITHFMEKTPECLRKLVAEMDETQLAYRTPEHPSIKELIGHLTDIDAVFYNRAWLLLETNNPELPQAHPPRLDDAAVYRERPIAELLASYQASRKKTLGLLRGLTSAAWHRTGHHELYGIINLIHQSNWMITHEKTHLIDMAQWRHDMLASADADQPHIEVAEVVNGVAEGV